MKTKEFISFAPRPYSQYFPQEIPQIGQVFDGNGNIYTIQPYTDNETLLINFLINNQFLKFFNPILSSLNGINYPFPEEPVFTDDNHKNRNNQDFKNINKQDENKIAYEIAFKIVDYIKHSLSPKNFINDIESTLRMALIVWLYKLILEYPAHIAFDIMKKIIDILLN
jgi:hypothetical protein